LSTLTEREVRLIPIIHLVIRWGLTEAPEAPCAQPGPLAPACLPLSSLGACRFRAQPSDYLVNRATQPCPEDAMRYLCLIYSDESQWGKLSKADMDSMMGEYFAFTKDIQKSGHYLGGEELQPTQTATTVRVRNGKISTTDGPYAETKEQLGGYYLINAKDLNDAIQVAARIPSVRVGSIEVRPIMEHNAP
jgi:hypothetical protein